MSKKKDTIKKIKKQCKEVLMRKFVRDHWREDIAMEMRHNILTDVYSTDDDWIMVAEYFTHE